MPIEPEHNSARRIDENGYINIEHNPISREGIFDYLARTVDIDHPEPNSIVKVYRPAKELQDPEAIESFKLIPFIDDHEMLGVADPKLTAPEERGVHGTTGDKVTYENGVLYANLKIFSNYLLDMLKRGKRDISLGYRCIYEKASGFFNGQPYDYIQRNLRGNHLALVDQARCAVSVLDKHIAFDRCDWAIDLEEFSTMADKDDKEKKEAEDAKMARDARMDKVCDWVESQMDKAAKDAKDAEEKEKADNEAKDKAAKDAEAKDAGANSRVKDESEEEKSAREKKEAKDKEDKEGMDSAIKGIAQDVSMLKSGSFIKGMFSHVKERNELAGSLSNYVGTFAADEMTVQEVAAYGVDKLKIDCPKGQELTAIKAFLHNRDTDDRRFSLDGRFTEKSKGKLDSYLAEMN